MKGKHLEAITDYDSPTLIEDVWQPAPWLRGAPTAGHPVSQKMETWGSFPVATRFADIEQFTLVAQEGILRQMSWDVISLQKSFELLSDKPHTASVKTVTDPYGKVQPRMFRLLVKLSKRFGGGGVLPGPGAQVQVQQDDTIADGIVSDPLHADGDIDFVLNLSGTDFKVTDEYRPVTLEPYFDTKTSKVQMTATSRLEAEYEPVEGGILDFKRIMLNLSSDHTKRVNLAETLSDAQVQDMLEGLDERQNVAVRQLLTAAGGLALMQGPPGTGKTATIGRCMSILVRAGQKVLAVGPSNGSVAALADSVFNDTSLRVCVYTSNHVNHAVIRECYKVDAQDNDGAINTMETDMVAVMHELAEAKGLPANVALRSVAAWKWRFLEWVRTGNTDQATIDVIKVPVEKWLTSMEKFFKGGQKGKDRKVVLAAWHQADAALTKLVLAYVDIIVCTCTLAGSEALQGAATPTVLILDEAATATDADLLVPAMGFAKSLRGVWLVGDHKQLGATVTSKGVNEFAHQLLLSTFQRLAEGDIVEKTRLNLCYRCSTEFTELSSIECYDGDYKSHPSTETLKPIVGHMREWWTNVANGDGELPVCSAIDLSGPRAAAERLEGTTTWQNPSEANAIANLVESILWAGKVKPHEIVILTPYSGQKKLILSLLAKKNIFVVVCRSVEQYHGNQVLLVIVSYTKNGGDLNWIADPRRLNVMLTRQVAMAIHVGAWTSYGCLAEAMLKVPERKFFGAFILRLHQNDRIVAMPKNLQGGVWQQDV
jgi:hypothetical protein